MGLIPPFGRRSGRIDAPARIMESAAPKVSLRAFEVFQSLRRVPRKQAPEASKGVLFCDEAAAEFEERRRSVSVARFDLADAPLHAHTHQPTSKGRLVVGVSHRVR